MHELVCMAIKSQYAGGSVQENFSGERMLKDRRLRAVDRRQQQRKLTEVPFKDSNGVTVRDERRFIPERRVDSIAVESDRQEPKTA